MINEKKVAIICDWIKDLGGAELVLEHIIELFPEADIFTSVFWQEWNPLFVWKKITTSFIQKIPFLNKSHKLALSLRPLAFESFDLSEYDIVISSSSAESKGIITKPQCIHICYCHTPTRYFWSHYHEYITMMEFGILNPLWKWLMPKIVYTLRQWDFIASKRVDFFVANSENTKERIKKYYKEDSQVIYPWIDTDNFLFSEIKKEYYFYIARCIPYKKMDLLVETFNKNNKKLILATNTDNKLYKKLRKKSLLNITWIFNPTKEEIKKLYAEARAFIFPPEEDFWLVPLEAMASGTPVIAYGKWWARETVIQWKTWIFFDNQTPTSINKSLEEFEEMSFDYKVIQKYAKKFDKKVFQEKFISFVKEKSS